MGAGRETGKQRDKQTKSWTDKGTVSRGQADKRAETDRAALVCASQAGQPETGLSVPVSQGLCWHLGVACSLCLHIHFPGCVCSPSHVPSPAVSLPGGPSPAALSVAGISLPALPAPSQGIQALPVAFGGHHRNWASPSGMNRRGQRPSLQEGKERAAGAASPGLVRLANEAGGDPAGEVKGPSAHPPVAQLQTKQTSSSGSRGECLICMLFASHLHITGSQSALPNSKLSPSSVWALGRLVGAGVGGRDGGW